MRALRVATLIVLGGLFLGGAAVPPQQPAADEALTNETLIKLVKAGLRDDVIIAMINSQPGQYSVNPKAVIAMKKAGVSDNVIAAIVDKSSGSAGQISQGAQISVPKQLAQPLPSAVADVPAAGMPRKLTVLAVSHSTSERDFTVTTPRTTNTNCDLYPNSVNCRSTSYGGGSQNRAVYFFLEVVTANEGGRVTQYTLSRTARWVWSSMGNLKEGDSFPAEIKGKKMSITTRRGGNQGKKEILKYDIVDIRPVP
jgi:hypothetical protein